DGPIDSLHLQRMTLGDPGLEREVLAMFSAQSARLVANLSALPADMAAKAHTLKGSARAIGAFAVAESAEELETAVRNGVDPGPALVRLRQAVETAREAIEARLRRS